MSTYYVEIILVVCIASATFATPVYDCDNGVPLPRDVQIGDCEIIPCALPQGSEVVMNATFRSAIYTEDMTPEVIAYSVGIELNYPFLDKDGCGALLNTRCPVEQQERTIFQLRMPILSLYPQVPVTFKFTLYGDNSIPLICFMVDAEITAPV